MKSAQHSNITLFSVTAPLDLPLLNKVSITSKNDTLVTLDELKHRIYFSRRVRQPYIEHVPRPGSPHLGAATQTMHTKESNSSQPNVNEHMQPAIMTHKELTRSQDTDGLAEYFRSQSSKNNSLQIPTINAPEDVRLCAALEDFMRSKKLKDPDSAMQHIQDLLGSMVIGKSNADPYALRSDRRQLEGHDTSAMMSDGGSYQIAMERSDRHEVSRYDLAVSRADGNEANSAQIGQAFQSAGYRTHLEPSPHQYNSTPENPYPIIQTMESSGPWWPESSPTCSPNSDIGSLNRQGSRSSQSSNFPVSPIAEHPFVHHRLRVPIIPKNQQVSYSDYHEYGQRRISNVSESGRSPAAVELPCPEHQIGQAEASSSVSINRTNEIGSSISPHHIPWLSNQQESRASTHGVMSSRSPLSIPGRNDGIQGASNLERAVVPDMLRSMADRNGSPSGYEATTVATTANAFVDTPNTKAMRHTSITPSIASTGSSGSGSISILPGSWIRHRSSTRSGSIQSGPVSKERMMEGRPDKHNNYWGFCKGAWAVREKMEKGIVIRTIPSGYYNSKQVWECKECSFRGEVFTTPHPTKKNKRMEVVDPQIHCSMSGIRYRWIFLAKSHVKRKAESLIKEQECNFGCVFCCVEGSVTSVYGGVETLMNHIAQAHVAEMSDRTRKTTNCILGRVATADEAFDVNIPIFEQIGELAG